MTESRGVMPHAHGEAKHHDPMTVQCAANLDSIQRVAEIQSVRMSHPVTGTPSIFHSFVCDSSRTKKTLSLGCNDPRDDQTHPTSLTGPSACSSGDSLMVLGRPAIRHTRVACAIGHSIYRGVAAEGEVDSTDATDGPATFARRQVE